MYTRYAHKPSHFANGEGKIRLAKVNRNTFAKLAKVNFCSCRTNIFIHVYFLKHILLLAPATLKLTDNNFTWYRNKYFKVSSCIGCKYQSHASFAITHIGNLPVLGKSRKIRDISKSRQGKSGQKTPFWRNSGNFMIRNEGELLFFILLLFLF